MASLPTRSGGPSVSAGEKPRVPVQKPPRMRPQPPPRPPIKPRLASPNRPVGDLARSAAQEPPNPSAPPPVSNSTVETSPVPHPSPGPTGLPPRSESSPSYPAYTRQLDSSPSCSHATSSANNTSPVPPPRSPGKPIGPTECSLGDPPSPISPSTVDSNSTPPYTPPTERDRGRPASPRWSLTLAKKHFDYEERHRISRSVSPVRNLSSPHLSQAQPTRSPLSSASPDSGSASTSSTSTVGSGVTGPLASPKAAGTSCNDSGVCVPPPVPKPRLQTQSLRRGSLPPTRSLPQPPLSRPPKSNTTDQQGVEPATTEVTSNCPVPGRPLASRISQRTRASSLTLPPNRKPPQPPGEVRNRQLSQSGDQLFKKRPVPPPKNLPVSGQTTMTVPSTRPPPPPKHQVPGRPPPIPRVNTSSDGKPRRPSFAFSETQMALVGAAVAKQAAKIGGSSRKPVDSDMSSSDVGLGGAGAKQAARIGGGCGVKLVGLPDSEQSLVNSNSLSSTRVPDDCSNKDMDPTVESVIEAAPASWFIPEVSVGKDHKAFHAVCELKHTELAYVRDLETILDVFLKTLTTLDPPPVVTPAEIATLFCNLEALLPLNRRLLKEIEDSLIDFSPSVEPFVCPPVGQVFHRLKGELGATYLPYCKGQDKAIRLAEALEVKSERFREFLESCRKRPECHLLDLRAFLIKPVQRICRYPLLLNEMIKLLPPEDPEVPFLQESCGYIKEVVTVINKHISTFEKVGHLRTLCGGDPKIDSLFPEGVDLLRDGSVQMIKKGTKLWEGYLMLTPSHLVFAKPSKALTKHKLVETSLSAALITDVPRAHFTHVFEIVDMSSKKKYQISCESYLDKLLWMDEIQSVIDSLRR